MDILTFSAVFSLALIGSFGHCVGMCGGFVLSYCAIKINPQQSKTYQSFMHLLYGLGRTTSYGILGALFGFFGSSFKASMFSKGILFFVLGIIMIIISISFIDRIKILDFFKIDILNFRFFKYIHKKTFSSKKPWSFYIFGMLNGFVPCGFVYFFATSSIATTSAISGIFTMVVFGLATIPALFLVGVLSGFAKNKYSKIFNYIAAFSIMGYGLITLIKGALMMQGINPKDLM